MQKPRPSQFYFILVILAFANLTACNLGQQLSGFFGSTDSSEVGCPDAGHCEVSYVKGPVPISNGEFGRSVSLDGETLAVSYLDNSGLAGVTNGTGGSTDTSESQSGALSVFTRSGTTWTQQAFIKSANPDASDKFGESISVYGDSLAVGAPYEDSSSNVITHGTGAIENSGATDSGAVYIFSRTSTSWTQQAYIKSSNNSAGQLFGSCVSFYDSSVAIGAPGDDSNQVTITNGVTSSSNTASTDSGAVFLYNRTGTTWVQQAYIKAPNNNSGDLFGTTCSLSLHTLAVGAISEDSNETSITNGVTASADNSMSASGAVYVYNRTGTTWAQQAYIKPDNTDASDAFGSALSLDRETLVVGAKGESSNATGVTNGTGASSNNTLASSGAAYVFKRVNSTWYQQAYLKPPTSIAGAEFGRSVAISGDRIVIGSPLEDSSSTGVTNGTGASANTSATNSGAAYVFVRSGSTWVQSAYIKSGNSEAGDLFGSSVAVSGDSAFISAVGEAGGSSGTSSTSGGSNNTTPGAGAVYDVEFDGITSAVFSRDPAQSENATSLPITFQLEFGREIDPSTFTTSDLSNSGSATGVTWTITDSGDHRTFTITATAATSTGTIIPNLGSGAITDIYGNSNQGASNNTDRTVNFAPSPASLYITSAQGFEGETIQFIVSITATNSFNVVFDYASILGSVTETGGTVATSGSDFTATSGTATIPAGSLSIAIPVVTLTDGSNEPIENFYVTISNATNGSIIRDVSTGLIYSLDCPTTGWCQTAFFKAQYVGANHNFGDELALSNDTLIVSTSDSSSSNVIINGTGASSNTAGNSVGAVYVYKRTAAGLWSQEAYLKPSFTWDYVFYGYSVAIDEDTIVVGAYRDLGDDTTLINGTGYSSTQNASGAGAAFVYKRTNSTWVQEAQLKPPYISDHDWFGYSVAIDKNTIVVSSVREDSNVTGVFNGTGASTDESVSDTGAAYVFKRTGNTWSREAFLKAPVNSNTLNFGDAVDIDRDTIVISAEHDDSGFDYIIHGTGGSSDTSATNSGAAHVFERTGNTWVQTAYIKPSQVSAGDLFGDSVSIHGDTMVIGAPSEDGDQTDVVNGTFSNSNDSGNSPGAAYVFYRTNGTWNQQAMLKPSLINNSANFGISSNIWGDVIAVGATQGGGYESTITNGTGVSNSGTAANGSAYVFRRTGSTWVREASIKPSNNYATNTFFGDAVSIDGDDLTVGASCFEGPGLSAPINGSWAPAASGTLCTGSAFAFTRKGSISVVVRQGADQVDPTTTVPIDFEVKFSRAIDASTFTTADISNTGSATGITWSIIDSGDHRKFTLRATAVTGAGTVIPRINAASVQDSTGSTNLVSSPNFDNQVTKSP